MFDYSYCKMWMRKMLNEWNQNAQFYTVSARTIVIPFYYGPIPQSSVIKLRFRFRYGKRLRFLRFWFSNTLNMFNIILDFWILRLYWPPADTEKKSRKNYCKHIRLTWQFLNFKEKFTTIYRKTWLKSTYWRRYGTYERLAINPNRYKYLTKKPTSQNNSKTYRRLLWLAASPQPGRAQPDIAALKKNVQMTLTRD